LSPLVTILETSTLVLGAMMPLELGLGLGDYYEQDTDDDVFGYWRGALALKLGFPCVPPCFGTWALSGGAALLVLGDNTSDLAGRRAEVIGFASLSLSP